MNTNENWFKVNKTRDLPTEKKLYRFIPCNDFVEEFIGWIDNELKEVFFVDFRYYNIQKVDGRNKTELNSWLDSQITHYLPIGDNLEQLKDDLNIKKKDEIESMLIDIFDRINISIPDNIEDITQFCFEDVCDTADPVDWHDGDVAIAFRRWIEKQI